MNLAVHTSHFDDNEEATQSHPVTVTGNTLFPIFLKLEQLDVLIIGGGNVGLEKLTAVLRNSPLAKVTLVGREIQPQIRAFATDFDQVLLLEKPFEPEDLAGKQLVIAATDDKALHGEIRRLAHELGILVNVADTPAECDFYLGSIVQKGDLKLAISTNGKSPTIAKRLRETLTEVLPNELHDLLQHMPAIRRKLGGDFSEKVRSLNALTSSLVAGEEALSAVFPHQNLERIRDRKWRRIATTMMAAFGMLLIFNII